MDVTQQVVDKFIVELQSQLDRKGVSLELTTAAKAWFADKGYDKAMGARPMSRLIQDKLKKPLANEVLFGALCDGGIVKVDIKDDEIHFIFEDKKELVAS
jgi:ATP-dependent Clp protease ATP-binding subunit ClpA